MGRIGLIKTQVYSQDIYDAKEHGNQQNKAVRKAGMLRRHQNEVLGVGRTFSSEKGDTDKEAKQQ